MPWNHQQRSAPLAAAPSPASPEALPAHVLCGCDIRGDDALERITGRFTRVLLSIGPALDFPFRA